MLHGGTGARLYCKVKVDRQGDVWEILPILCWNGGG